MLYVSFGGKDYWFDDGGYWEVNGANGTWRRIPHPTIRPHPQLWNRPDMEASSVETDGHINPKVIYDPRKHRPGKEAKAEVTKAPEVIAPSVLDLPDEDLIKMLDGKK